MYRLLTKALLVALVTVCSLAQPAKAQDRVVGGFGSMSRLQTLHLTKPPFYKIPNKLYERKPNCGCAPRHITRPATPPPTQPSRVRVEILSDGKVITEQTIRPHDRKSNEIVFPKFGAKYEIRVSCVRDDWPTQWVYRYRRQLVDVEVDGLSAMNGKPREYQPYGYVLAADQNYTIKGWRSSDKTVQRFVVSKPKESLAAAQNQSQKVGKIVIRTFGEAKSVQLGPLGQQSGRRWNSFANSALSFNTGAASRSRSAAGTAKGERVESKIGYTSFRPDLASVGVLEFTYRVSKSSDLETRD